MTTTDGITKRFSDGDVLLVEDTTGDISLCTETMPELTYPQQTPSFIHELEGHLSKFRFRVSAIVETRRCPQAEDAIYQELYCSC